MAKSADPMRVEVRRRMPAPRDIVFEAWTDPEGLRHWMCPGDVISAEAALDVRVGGNFRLVMKSKTAEHVHTGTYQVVDPPANPGHGRIPRPRRGERNCADPRGLHADRRGAALPGRLGKNHRTFRRLPCPQSGKESHICSYPLTIQAPTRGGATLRV